MDYLQQFIDLHRRDIDPEVFAIALAPRYIRSLINQGGSEIGRPDIDSGLHPQHLEAFLACTVKRAQRDKSLAQEWHRLQQVLPPLRGAWEKGKHYSRKTLTWRRVIRKMRNFDEDVGDYVEEGGYAKVQLACWALVKRDGKTVVAGMIQNTQEWQDATLACVDEERKNCIGYKYPGCDLDWTFKVTAYRTPSQAQA